MDNIKTDCLDVCCTSCYDNSIKISISTDNGEFNNVETFIDNDYLDWSMKNNKVMLSLLNQGLFGQYYHTDPLLFNIISSPTAKNISNYIETINNHRRGRSHSNLVGYSVCIDEDSFNAWA